VLIVNNDAATRALLRTSIEALPVQCEIREAQDGDAALSLAQRTRPDLVLLDVVLPESSISGVLLCRELCKDSRTKVVVVTRQCGQSIINTCFYMGASAHLQVPLPVDEMSAQLSEWIP
jgi:CheY-like chemotaxis protein